MRVDLARGCPSKARLSSDHGSGLVATLSGVLVFLLFLLLASQVLIHLYATSVVTAAAFDAARIVSGSDGGPARQAEALASAEDLLGGFGDDVSLTFSRIDDEVVVLQVRAESPSLLPRMWSRVTGVGRIEREIRMRREAFR